MAFMTPAEIKAVRLKGSKVVTIEALGKEVRIIKMASAAQMKSAELNEEVRAGRKKTTDTFLFLLEHGLSDLEGNPLTADDAKTIFELLPQSGLLSLVKEISTLIGGDVVVRKASDEPAVEQTPAEKKD